VTTKGVTIPSANLVWLNFVDVTNAVTTTLPNQRQTGVAKPEVVECSMQLASVVLFFFWRKTPT